MQMQQTQQMQRRVKDAARATGAAFTRRHEGQQQVVWRGPPRSCSSCSRCRCRCSRYSRRRSRSRSRCSR